MTTARTDNRDAMAAAQGIFDQLAAAWNNADGAAYGQAFADDADFVDIRGVHHTNAGEAIGAGHQTILDTIYRGSTIEYRIDTIRHLNDGLALVHATSTLNAPTGPLEGEHQSRITAVLTTPDDGPWRILSLHNTLIADGPGT